MNSPFRSIRALPLFFGLVLAFGSSACGGGGVDGPGLEANVAAVKVPLTSWSQNGEMYRLTGTFTVTGGQTITTTGDEPSIEFALAAGDHEIALTAWDLYQVQENNVTVNVTSAAVLTSENPLAFTVESGAVTPLAFVFDLSGDGIEFGEGVVDVGFDVIDDDHSVQVAAGGAHTCALLKNGAVRCWGSASFGKLGYGNTNSIGDSKLPNTAGDVPLGGSAVGIAAGDSHTCALMKSGAVRCWGYNQYGQLGFGNRDNIGYDETPASVGDVPLGGSAVAITAGGYHTCALMESGRVRCWGQALRGQLGYGNTNNIGDDESPASVGDVPFGDAATAAIAVSAGGGHTCALMESGRVRCWGGNDSGQLGYGNTNSISVPAVAGDVQVGAKAVAIVAANSHTCALTESGGVRCWGRGDYGKLGYGNENRLGDNEFPSAAGDVSVGGTAVAISAGYHHTCAVLATGRVRCWGHAAYGQLGYGNTNNIGDNEVPSTAGGVPVTLSAASISVGTSHACVVTDADAIFCWGYAASGQLGYGNVNNIGDNETPISAGQVAYR